MLIICLLYLGLAGGVVVVCVWGEGFRWALGVVGTSLAVAWRCEAEAHARVAYTAHHISHLPAPRDVPHDVLEILEDVARPVTVRGRVDPVVGDLVLVLGLHLGHLVHTSVGAHGHVGLADRRGDGGDRGDFIRVLGGLCES